MEPMADLLVLPELFNTGYLITSKEEIRALAEEVPGGRTTQRLAALAKRSGVHLVAGMAERSGDRIFNAAVLISPSGHVATYRKVHLFFEEKLWFDPGDGEFPVYDIGLCRVGMMVCFDWFFPESARMLALKGAQVICHPSNLVLPYCQTAMVTRCLENRVFAVTCNRTGTEQRGGKVLHIPAQARSSTRGGISCRGREKMKKSLSWSISTPQRRWTSSSTCTTTCSATADLPSTRIYLQEGSGKGSRVRDRVKGKVRDEGRKEDFLSPVTGH